jgi:hypothetical protein
MHCCLRKVCNLRSFNPGTPYPTMLLWMNLMLTPALHFQRGRGRQEQRRKLTGQRLRYMGGMHPAKGHTDMRPPRLRLIKCLGGLRTERLVHASDLGSRVHGSEPGLDRASVSGRRGAEDISRRQWVGILSIHVIDESSSWFWSWGR